MMETKKMLILNASPRKKGNIAQVVTEMAAMRADERTLDVGYIGAGVAWNPIDSTGNQLSFIFLDCLSNAENLIAKKGIFNDANGNGKYDNDEIFEGLHVKPW